MPDVRIRFQGLCMFCAQDEKIRVYLPNASGTAGGPIDGSGHAETHHAKILVQKREGGSSLGDYDIFPLDGIDVSFIGEDGNPIGGGVNPAALAGLPHFRDFATGVALEPGVTGAGANDLRVAATVMLAGGTLDPVAPPINGPWKIRKLKGGAAEDHLPAQLTYWMNVEMAGVTHVQFERGGQKHLHAVAGTEIIIGNRPADEPLLLWLRHLPAWQTGGTCDHHFPWHYSLLHSTNGTDLPTRLRALGHTPAPCFRNGHPHPHSGTGGSVFLMSDDYPTCFCASC